MTVRAVVLLAQGAEEMETTIVVDVLRRAQVEVVLAGVDGVAAVTCSRGVRLLPDAALETLEGPFDAVILPGGTDGAERLAQSQAVGRWVRAQWDGGGLVAAVCAGPIALQAHGVGIGMTITSHPSVRDRLSKDYALSDARVVHSQHLITSQGPGTSFEFALAIVRALCGRETAERVAQPMLLPDTTGRAANP